MAGWVGHTDAEFTLRRVPGGHRFYRDAPLERWAALAASLVEA